MIKAANTQRWVFDPQDAVALLFDERPEKHAFEIPLKTYLLFTWALWPTDVHADLDPKIKLSGKNAIRMLSSARGLGAVVTFTKLNVKRNKPNPTNRRVESTIDFVRQAVLPWYEVFTDCYLEPVGGFSAQALLSSTVRWRQKAIRHAWDETLLTRDVVRYLCGIDWARLKNQAPRQSLELAMSNNVFNRDRDYRQRKRKNPEVSPSKIRGALRHPTAVLLYAIERCFPELIQLKMSNKGFLRSLCSLTVDKRRMMNVLLYYKQLIDRLHPVIGKVDPDRRWKLLNVLAEVPPTIKAEVERNEVLNADQRRRAKLP